MNGASASFVAILPHSKSFNQLWVLILSIPFAPQPNRLEISLVRSYICKKKWSIIQHLVARLYYYDILRDSILMKQIYGPQKYSRRILLKHARWHFQDTLGLRSEWNA
jgi:hypothetical protein